MTGVTESAPPAKPKAPAPWPAWDEMIQQHVAEHGESSQGRNVRDERNVERRIDRNGQAYTWEQFQSFYRDRAAQKWYESTVAPHPFSVWHNKK